MNYDTFAPGERLIIRDEEWLVRRSDITSSGAQALTVVGISPLVQGQERIFLTSLEDEIEVVDPCKTTFVQDDSPNYRQSRLYVECLLRHTPPTDGELYIGHKAAIDLVPYQLDPAFLALKAIRQRILMADAVGLGKTIECGILLSELIRRGRGKRIMVLTMKSMLTQFQKELWARFSIPLVRLDSGGIQKVRNRIPANENPFYYYDKIIISIDTLKQESEYRVFLEDKEVHWDVIVIDEAHNVAVRSNQSMRAKLAKLLADKSDSLIMLSATPHDGKRQSFASLMDMLNPTAIADPENYKPEDIKGLFIRRFKKDIKRQVSDKFLERIITKDMVKATPAEERAYDVLANMSFASDSGRKSGTMLFKTTLEKSLFSSPAACRETLKHRIDLLGKKGGFEKDIAQLQKLDELLLSVDAAANSKYQRLVALLKPRQGELKWNPAVENDRVVIFTERIETMRFLHENLMRDLGLKAEQMAVMYGGISDVELQKTVEDFGNGSSKLRLLICSDIASEGINLHYKCHRMIHFDIPWSLIVFQQRNGRVDRYGQENQPEIHYLCVDSANSKIHGDHRILELLIEKDKEVQESIGDPSEFTRNYTQEDDENSVGSAMEAGESAEEFEARLSSVGGLEDLLFGDAGKPSSDSAADHCKSMPTLYASDFQYTSEALAFLTSQNDEHLQYEIFTNGNTHTVAVTPTPELHYRLKFLPPEILPDQGQFVLCDDRHRLNEEIKRCRDAVESWPAVQLLWEQHPFMEYLNDKVLATFARQQAPVMEMPDKLAANEMVYIVSAVIPNRNGQPMLFSWYGVHYLHDAFVDIKPLTEWIAPLGLNQPGHPNPLHPLDPAPLQKLLPDVVSRVKDSMVQERKELDSKNLPQLENQLKALEELKGKHLRQLEFEFADQLQTERTKNKKEQRSKELERVFNEYFDWINNSMLIEDKPYIQIAAVVTGGN